MVGTPETSLVGIASRASDELLGIPGINSGKCACGMTSDCDSGKKCNCDKNDKYWHEDRGYLTNKNRLPVAELRFGDTGDGTNNEHGYPTLGKLQCWG